MKLVHLAIALIVLRGVCAAQPFTEAEKRINDAEDRRDVNALMQLAAKNPAGKAMVLRALGSVQSADALPFIEEALRAKKPELRAAAAFALGQTLREQPFAAAHEGALLAAIDMEKDPAALCEELDAIGRCGSADALARVALFHAPPAAMEAQALAIARFAVRSITSPQATAAAAACWPACRKPHGLNAALYALFRIGDSAMLAPFDTIARAALHSTNADERAHAVAILGRMHQRGMFHHAIVAISDKDWRVSVSGIRAAAAFKTTNAMADSLQEAYGAILHRGTYQQTKTVLQTVAAAKAPFAKLVPIVKRLREKTASADLKEDALAALARIAPELAAAILDATTAEKATPAAYHAAAALIKRAPNGYTRFIPFIRAALRNADALRATAAIEAWHDVSALRGKHGVTGIDTVRYEQELLLALAHHAAPGHARPGPVETIVEMLGDTASLKQEYLRPFVAALHAFSSRDNVEAVGSLLDAVAKFHGQEAIEAIRPYLADSTAAVRKRAATLLRGLGVADAREADTPAADADAWRILGRMKTNPVVFIKTSKGVIKAELFLHDAPFTVASFLRLARLGFYDGLTFHRVVPNFVVQGGDPLGDGTGGPPWTIRSEFSGHGFERGTLGIASSGKDTEGSQFFVMHAPHPHLDGKYTTFGRVLSGMDAVDALEIGDRIMSVREAPARK